MQPDRFASPASGARALGMDAGLRGHMQRVYNRMTAGVLLTGLVAWFVANTPALYNLLMGGPQAYIVMLAPLALVWFGFRPDRMSSGALRLSFLGLCVLYGISFSAIALHFSGESIARAFFMTAGAFAGLSIYGYTTKKDLSGMASFMIMGMFGLLFFSLGTMAAGLFGVETSGMQNVICALGIVIFAGLTAWETQATKEMYHPSAGDEGNSRMAWMAALNLYISFIALFQYILHFMGNRE